MRYGEQCAFTHPAPSLTRDVQILEEGKAFELAGNRWVRSSCFTCADHSLLTEPTMQHIDCFRCNTCGK